MMNLPLERRPFLRASVAAVRIYAGHGLLLGSLYAIGFLVSVWRHWIHFSVIGFFKYSWTFTGLLLLVWPFLAVPIFWREFKRTQAGWQEVAQTLACLLLIAALTWVCQRQLQNYIP